MSIVLLFITNFFLRVKKKTHVFFLFLKNYRRIMFKLAYRSMMNPEDQKLLFMCFLRTIISSSFFIMILEKDKNTLPFLKYLTQNFNILFYLKLQSKQMSWQLDRSEMSSEDVPISAGIFLPDSNNDYFVNAIKEKFQYLDIRSVSSSQDNNCSEKKADFFIGATLLDENINLLDDDACDHFIDDSPQHEQIGSVKFSSHLQTQKIRSRASATSKLSLKSTKPANLKKIKKPKKKKAKIIENCRSQTKNIPKNYGKQIIKFILKDQKAKQKIQQVLEKDSMTFDELKAFLIEKKQQMNKISNLRNLWIGNKYEKPLRILSQYFLRKKALSWIFNSRIEKIQYPIKYRAKIFEGVKNPEKFQNLKDF